MADPGELPTVAHVPSEPDAPVAGQRIRYFGDYELLGEIARGGMGVVYKARQVKLNRTVALKMILSGQLASVEDVRRFQVEAEAAANLDHSGIVPIYEVGEHDGFQYFSMGFVDGQSLGARLADGPLPPRDAAILVKAVAEAVQYAHERGVVHRDLKPGNILLDRDGRPRVTDFGLAKRVDNDSGLTATGQVLGTPNYMPPEQAAGQIDAVGPASDVYSLGAVLYAALTGRPPFQAATPVETLSQVISREPVSPRSLNPVVPRDLETITLKCLAKPIGRRYASAGDLANDLRRYLAGEPIHARPTGQAERLWRWARRNPVVAGLSAVLLSVFVGGFAAVVSLWLLAEGRGAEARRDRDIAAEQRRLADRNFLQARKAVDQYLKLVADDPLLADRFPELRRRLLESALKYYQDFSAQRGGDQELRSELMHALLNVASINNLAGSKDQALAAFRSVQEMLELHLREHPAEMASRQQLAECCYSSGQILIEMERTAEAQPMIERAIALRRALHAESPNDTKTHAELAAACNLLGLFNLHIYKPAEAIPYIEEATSLEKQLAEAHPDEPEHESQLGAFSNNLGMAYRMLDQPVKARDAFEQAVEHQRQAVKREPANRRFIEFLANHYFNLGKIDESLSHWAVAAESVREARDRNAQLVESNPGIISWRYNLARSTLVLGQLQAKSGKSDQADAPRLLEQARAMLVQLASENASLPDIHDRLAETHVELAKLHESARRWDAALRSWTAARDICEPHLGDDPLNREKHLANLADCNLRIGAIYAQQGQNGQAAAAWKRARELGETLVAEFPGSHTHGENLATCCNALGLALKDAGQAAEAEAAYRRTIELLQGLPQALADKTDNRISLGGVFCNLGHLLAHQRPQEAIACYQQAAQTLELVLRGTPKHQMARQFYHNTVAGWTSTLDGMRRLTDAIAVLDHALELDDGTHARSFRFSRARLLVRQGKHQEGLAEIKRLNSKDLAPYDLACVYSLASAAAANDKELSPEESSRLLEQYASRAIELLRIEFTRSKSNAKLLERETDLDPLRSRTAFRELVAELKQKL